MTVNIVYLGGPEDHMRHTRNSAPPLDSVITVTEAIGRLTGGFYRVTDLRSPIEGDTNYVEVYAKWVRTDRR